MPINKDGTQPPLNVAIQSLDDLNKGKTMWDDNVLKEFLENGNRPCNLDFGYVAILESGMKSGATSIGFWLIDKWGQRYWAEMSSKMLLGLATVVGSAEMRFIQEQVERNKKN